MLQPDAHSESSDSTVRLMVQGLSQSFALWRRDQDRKSRLIIQILIILLVLLAVILLVLVRIAFRISQ